MTARVSPAAIAALLVAAFFAITVVSGCVCRERAPDRPSSQLPLERRGQDWTQDARDADSNTLDPLGERISSIVYLDQGWSRDDSLRFYFTTQGSHIIPYDWFLALEQAASETLFRDNANMLKYRYLVQRPGPQNPDGLPVGFAKDQADDRAWLGLTCAGCHTAQLNYGGVGYRVDGGPAQSDLRSFAVDLAAALRRTREDSVKFNRFAGRVLGAGADNRARDTLRRRLSEIIAIRDGYNARNFTAPVSGGFGRVDAFGAILNEVYFRAVKNPHSPTVNTNPSDAPVSYPFLWDTPQHDRVQWNGAAMNEGLGSLGRNVGEVLGVFAQYSIPEGRALSGYKSSVRVGNLLLLERWITTLWSPKWPAAFPGIDADKRDKGRDVYKNACESCHAVMPDRTDPGRRIEAVLRRVGTDPRMFDNFSNRSGDAGKLEGKYLAVIPLPVFQPVRIGAVAAGEEALGHLVRGTIIGSALQPPIDELRKVQYARLSALLRVSAVEGGLYKARPLNGIWATAPYLHNGSVQSLYELLLPAASRQKSFSVGVREFDPIKVGLRGDVPGFPKFEVTDSSGETAIGNSNAGHEYGSQLSEAEKWQLIEFLKSL